MDCNYLALMIPSAISFAYSAFRFAPERFNSSRFLEIVIKLQSIFAPPYCTNELFDNLIEERECISVIGKNNFSVISLVFPP